MDHKRTIEEAVAATRESILDDYWNAQTDNPRIEAAHTVNLGSLASKYRVVMNVTDLDVAIESVNADFNIEPPIRRLGSIVLNDPASKTHFTTARGVEMHHISTALWRIAAQKSRDTL